MPRSLKDQYPMRLFIGTEDVTFLLDNGGTFSNTDPGGYEAASWNIPKDLPSTLRGQNVRLDCGLHVAWEGRVSQIQRSLGAKTQIQCEGYGAIFKEESSSMVFVDRSLTQWTSPTYARQIAWASGVQSLGSYQVAADPTNNTPALVLEIDGAWVSPYLPISEAWYLAGPENTIDHVWYDLTPPTGSGWTVRLISFSDPAGDSFVAQGNLFGGGEVSGYWNPGTAYGYLAAQMFDSTTPGGADGAQYMAFWHNLAVYGPHGLTGRGSDPVGFYPSDVAGWVVRQAPGIAPGVTQATDSSGYILPHSVYYTPVTLDQMMGDMATISYWHWGVWDSLSPLTGNATPRCDFRPRPAPGAWTAFCERGACDTLDIREDLSGQYNKCVVSFSNVDGTNGAAIVTTDNPILDQAGIPSRVMVLNGGTMTPATAAAFGVQAMAAANAESRVAGSADVISTIDAPAGPMPAWLLKAGIDRLRIGDAPSTDAFGAMSDFPITRVECSLSSSGINTSVELGQGADLVETIQARLTAASALAQQ